MTHWCIAQYSRDKIKWEINDFDADAAADIDLNRINAHISSVEQRKPSNVTNVRNVKIVTCKPSVWERERIKSVITTHTHTHDQNAIENFDSLIGCKECTEDNTNNKPEENERGR